jgi:hypothetical protein
MTLAERYGTVGELRGELDDGEPAARAHRATRVARLVGVRKGKGLTPAFRVTT